MIDLNDSVWKGLHSAGNDADKLLRCLVEEEGEFYDNMQVLAEDLSHQLSYYSATAYVLPHLAALYPKLALEEQVFLVAQMGAAIAAEAKWMLSPDTEPYQEFQEGLAGLRPKMESLITNPDVIAMLKEDLELDQQFALSALAILGERKHAYTLYLLSGSCWEVGCAACTCGWNEEELLLAEQPDCVEPAAIGSWDGKTLTDEPVWFHGLLELAGDEDISPVLPLVYGTGICPECGKRESYWNWFDRFMEEY